MQVKLYITTLHNILVNDHHIGSPLCYDTGDNNRNKDLCGSQLENLAGETMKYYVKSVRIYTINVLSNN